MGLDIHLYAISRRLYWYQRSLEPPLISGIPGLELIDRKSTCEIVTEIGYWRGAYSLRDMLIGSLRNGWGITEAETSGGLNGARTFLSYGELLGMAQWAIDKDSQEDSSYSDYMLPVIELAMKLPRKYWGLWIEMSW